MAYDTRYRLRVVEYRLEGHTEKETHETFKVCVSTIREWVGQYQETGNADKKPLNRSFKKIDPGKLKTYIEEHPDAYLQEMADEFGCNESAIRKALKKLKITRKKRELPTKSKIQGV